MIEHDRQPTGGPEIWRGERPRAVVFELLVVFVPLLAGLLMAGVLRNAVLGLAGMVASVLLGWRALRRRGLGWRGVGLGRPTSINQTLFFAVSGALLLLVLTSIAGPVLQRVSGLTPKLDAFEVLEGNVTALVSGLVVVWTTAAFGEEILFRGLLLNGLGRVAEGWTPSSRVGWGVALVVSSAVFGLGHLYQGIAGVILAALLGAGYGGLYLATGGNLWVAVLSHGLYDTIGFLVVFAGGVPLRA